MNKHTPGPWVAHYDSSWSQWSVRSANAADLAEAPIYYELADRIGGHVRGEDFSDYSEVEANARLIAAAPDLLAELEETHAALCFTPDYIGTERHKRNSAAIAKARGEA